MAAGKCAISRFARQEGRAPSESLARTCWAPPVRIHGANYPMSLRPRGANVTRAISCVSAKFHPDFGAAAFAAIRRGRNAHAKPTWSRIDATRHRKSDGSARTGGCPPRCFHAQE